MRLVILCGLAAAFATQASAQPAAPAHDTLREVIARGQTLAGEVGGVEVVFSTTYSADGAYRTVTTAPDRTMTGKWRIEGDKLCTMGDANPTVDCTAYPPGKRSGDTFEVEHPRLGRAKVTIN